MRVRPSALAIASFILITLPVRAESQVPAPGDSLLRTISALDSALFDAYNHCELATLASYFTSDIEFYHDQAGLSRGRPPLLNDLRKYVCGKVRRDLVAGTLEVSPLRHYGAVETGLHRFCDATKYRACQDSTSGIAKFVHVWRHKDGQWQISRVISYDHASSHQ